MPGTTRVGTADELLGAIAASADEIEVVGRIAGLDAFRLPKRTRLLGVGGDAQLVFREGRPGVTLDADGSVRDLRIVVDEAQVAVGLADDVDGLGKVSLERVRTVGRVHLESACAATCDIDMRDVHVERADSRMAARRPVGFGVEVLLGGITVYNASRDVASRWTLRAVGLSGGSAGSPLRGSGVFVFGGAYVPADADPGAAPSPYAPGGSIEAELVATGEIHARGGIPEGTPDIISGGVFIGSGVHAVAVENAGAVTTYGPNDMVLDNWGDVESWTVAGAATSYGSSGIGFVNFGSLDRLRADAAIETHGAGARGFNLYDGTLRRAEFSTILTHGDGAVGIQISKPFGTIVVDGDVRTEGGAGESLVRGKVVRLQASALSLKPGASGDRIEIRGRCVAEDAEVTDLDFAAPASCVGSIVVDGSAVGA